VAGESNDDQDRPSMTESEAQKYIGKYILVGITQEDAFGKVTGQFQVHGVIELVAPDGVTIALRGTRQGEYYVIPPVLSDLDPAEPGEYRLHSTGELVIDPDYMTSFTITPPQKH
jgi:hypothetical protein